MVELVFADEIERACRYCATFARASAENIYKNSLVPCPEDETATVAFVRFEGRTFAVTNLHVITAFARLAEREGRVNQGYFLPAGRGIRIQAPFIPAPQTLAELPPDVALREIDTNLPAHLGKEAFELRPDVRPAYPVQYAAAVGFPTAAKENRIEPIGWRLAMRCAQAVAEGVGAPESADQIQFFSEIEGAPQIESLSGMSGGPAFWSDGERLGLLGFVKEALDVTPRAGEGSIYSRPRVNFIVQHATYETFGHWTEHALREWPRRRAELNRMADLKAAIHPG